MGAFAHLNWLEKRLGGDADDWQNLNLGVVFILHEDRVAICGNIFRIVTIKQTVRNKAFVTVSVFVKLVKSLE